MAAAAAHALRSPNSKMATSATGRAAAKKVPITIRPAPASGTSGDGLRGLQRCMKAAFDDPTWSDLTVRCCWPPASRARAPAAPSRLAPSTTTTSPSSVGVPTPTALHLRGDARVAADDIDEDEPSGKAVVVEVHVHRVVLAAWSSALRALLLEQPEDAVDDEDDQDAAQTASTREMPPERTQRGSAPSVRSPSGTSMGPEDDGDRIEIPSPEPAGEAAAAFDPTEAEAWSAVPLKVLRAGTSPSDGEHAPSKGSAVHRQLELEPRLRTDPYALRLLLAFLYSGDIEAAISASLIDLEDTISASSSSATSPSPGSTKSRRNSKDEPHLHHKPTQRHLRREAELANVVARAGVLARAYGVPELERQCRSYLDRQCMSIEASLRTSRRLAREGGEHADGAGDRDEGDEVIEENSMDQGKESPVGRDETNEIPSVHQHQTLLQLPRHHHHLEQEVSMEEVDNEAESPLAVLLAAAQQLPPVSAIASPALGEAVIDGANFSFNALPSSPLRSAASLQASSLPSFEQPDIKTEGRSLRASSERRAPARLTSDDVAVYKTTWETRKRRSASAFPEDLSSPSSPPTSSAPSARRSSRLRALEQSVMDDKSAAAVSDARKRKEFADEDDEDSAVNELVIDEEEEDASVPEIQSIATRTRQRTAAATAAPQSKRQRTKEAITVDQVDPFEQLNDSTLRRTRSKATKLLAEPSAEISSPAPARATRRRDASPMPTSPLHQVDSAGAAEGTASLQVGASETEIIAAAAASGEGRKSLKQLRREHGKNCHNCKTRKIDVVSCAVRPTHRFCDGCLRKLFGVEFDRAYEWEGLVGSQGCPICRRVCPCVGCRKRQQHKLEHHVVPQERPEPKVERAAPRQSEVELKQDKQAVAKLGPAARAKRRREEDDMDYIQTAAQASAAVPVESEDQSAADNQEEPAANPTRQRSRRGIRSTELERLIDSSTSLIEPRGRKRTKLGHSADQDAGLISPEEATTTPAPEESFPLMDVPTKRRTTRRAQSPETIMAIPEDNLLHLDMPTKRRSARKANEALLNVPSEPEDSPPQKKGMRSTDTSSRRSARPSRAAADRSAPTAPFSVPEGAGPEAFLGLVSAGSALSHRSTQRRTPIRATYADD